MKWLYDNKEWLFSGIGILLITSMFGLTRAIIKHIMKKRKTLSSTETKSNPTENEKSESNVTSIIIMIDKNGKIVHNSEVTCHIVYWIANGCVPDISIIVQDDRINHIRNELLEVEKRIETESCSEQLTSELLSIKKQLRKIETYDYRVERILFLFVRLNYTNQYITITQASDFLLFVETVLSFVEMGPINQLQFDDNAKGIDFSLRRGIYKNDFYFCVYINKSSLLKTGLGDNLNFVDVALLSYRDFDRATQIVILATFLQKLQIEEERFGRMVWEDSDAQVLMDYELGLH